MSLVKRLEDHRTHRRDAGAAGDEDQWEIV
jgi:hypothetical protein